jgi:hypothetical protein
VRCRQIAVLRADVREALSSASGAAALKPREYDLDLPYALRDADAKVMTMELEKLKAEEDRCARAWLRGFDPSLCHSQLCAGCHKGLL